MNAVDFEAIGRAVVAYAEQMVAMRVSELAMEDRIKAEIKAAGERVVTRDGCMGCADPTCTPYASVLDAETGEQLAVVLLRSGVGDAGEELEDLEDPLVAVWQDDWWDDTVVAARVYDAITVDEHTQFPIDLFDHDDIYGDPDKAQAWLDSLRS